MAQVKLKYRTDLGVKVIVVPKTNKLGISAQDVALAIGMNPRPGMVPYFKNDVSRYVGLDRSSYIDPPRS